MAFTTHVHAIRYLREQGFIVENTHQSRTIDDPANIFNDYSEWTVVHKGVNKGSFTSTQLIRFAQNVEVEVFLGTSSDIS